MLMSPARTSCKGMTANFSDSSVDPDGFEHRPMAYEFGKRAGPILANSHITNGFHIAGLDVFRFR